MRRIFTLDHRFVKRGVSGRLRKKRGSGKYRFPGSCGVAIRRGVMPRALHHAASHGSYEDQCTKENRHHKNCYRQTDRTALCIHSSSPPIPCEQQGLNHVTLTVKEKQQACQPDSRGVLGLRSTRLMFVVFPSAQDVFGHEHYERGMLRSA